MEVCAYAVAKSRATAHAETGHDALACGNPRANTDANAEEVALIEKANTIQTKLPQVGRNSDIVVKVW